MTRHLSANPVRVPTAAVASIGGRLTSHPLPNAPFSLGLGWAIGLVTTVLVAGAALATATPPAVTVPLATVLGSGLIAGVLVAKRRSVIRVRRRD